MLTNCAFLRYADVDDTLDQICWENRIQINQTCEDTNTNNMHQKQNKWKLDSKFNWQNQQKTWFWTITNTNRKCYDISIYIRRKKRRNTKKIIEL